MTNYQANMAPHDFWPYVDVFWGKISQNVCLILESAIYISRIFPKGIKVGPYFFLNNSLAYQWPWCSSKWGKIFFANLNFSCWIQEEYLQWPSKCCTILYFSGRMEGAPCFSVFLIGEKLYQYDVSRFFLHFLPFMNVVKKSDNIFTLEIF